MRHRLDRHVLGTFLLSALIAGGAFFCLFVMVDGFQHFEEFLKSARDQGRGLARVILSYYLHQIPLMAHFLSPVVACAAAGAAVTKMVRQNETVVLKASGVSLYRTGLPILAGAALLGLGMAADQELVIPRVAPTVVANEKASLARRQDAVVWDIFRIDRYRRAFQIQKYHRTEHRMENVTITQVDERGMKRRVIYAAQVAWKADPEGVPTVVLSNGVDYSYPEGDTFGAMMREFGEHGLEFKTSLSEASLLERDVNPLLMNSRELEAHLAATPADRRTAVGGRLETALNRRLPECLSPLLLALLAVPLVLWQDTRNFAWGLALALSAWVGYFVLSQVCGQLGAQWLLTPRSAAWIPAAVIGAPGLVLYLRMRT